MSDIKETKTGYNFNADNYVYTEATDDISVDELTVTITLNRGRPKKDNIIREGSQAGLTEDFTRATFIVNVDLLEEVKNYAYTERLSIKDAVNKLLSDSLEAYKKDGGTLLDRKGGEKHDYTY